MDILHRLSRCSVFTSQCFSRNKKFNFECITTYFYICLSLLVIWPAYMTHLTHFSIGTVNCSALLLVRNVAVAFCTGHILCRVAMSYFRKHDNK